MSLQISAPLVTILIVKSYNSRFSFFNGYKIRLYSLISNVNIDLLFGK